MTVICRGKQIQVIRILDDAAFIKFIAGPTKGTTGWVLLDEIEGLEPAPTEPATCRCLDAKGFRMDEELNMYVHAACGRPTSMALEAAARESGLVW